MCWYVRSIWWKLPLLHNWKRDCLSPQGRYANRICWLRADVTASSCKRDCTDFLVTSKWAELSQWPSAFCIEKNSMHSPLCCSIKVFFVHSVRAVQRWCYWEKYWKRWGFGENCDGKITVNHWHAREDHLLLPSAVFLKLLPPFWNQILLLTHRQMNMDSDFS